MDNKDFTAIEGQSIKLPCKVQGDPWPQVVWTKNGIKINETDPHYFATEDGILEIFSVSTSDSAIYFCTATNVAGSKEKRVSLSVHGKFTS